VSLGMTSPPSAEYIEHGINGHQYRYPRDEQPQMVLNRLDCYWAGAPLMPHDFSRYAMHLDRRMCNYLPENPYGLVPIVPADTPAGKRPGRTFITDGRYFFDGGARREAAEFRSTVESALREAATRLPLRVFGPAHWSVVRLDPSHVRVTLIDPGYLDPADRDVEIMPQHLADATATDILSGETLDTSTGRIALRIPAGTLRIIDLSHR
jgi:lambda-carrageenase